MEGGEEDTERFVSNDLKALLVNFNQIIARQTDTIAHRDITCHQVPTPPLPVAHAVPPGSDAQSVSRDVRQEATLRPSPVP